ncbi:MAG: perosamine synthetase [Gemmataceae bacterium]|nr:perosamine synthetase [Gemmataceae bacterium]
MADDLPALLGGTPVRPEGPPSWPLPNAAIATAIQVAVADGSWGQYHGPHIPRLEWLLAEAHGLAHAITCATGTLAVEIALRAVGVGPGDEVILGAYDYEPSFLSVHAIGAIPVLVDIVPGSACLDPAHIERAVSPKTKAILATHLHGGLVEMPRIVDMASRLGVPVIEDAAQVPGATVAGRPAGSWGELGILSFGGSKLLTAGRGGAILTNRADLAQRARLSLSRGVQHWAPLSELQAIALIPQVEQLSKSTARRHRMVSLLVEQIREIPGLTPFRNENSGSRSAYYKLGFLLDSEAFGLSRDRFVKAIRAEGIAFDAGFRSLQVGRAPSRYRASGPLPNAELAGKTVVTLHHPVLSLGEAEIEQVAEAVRKTYRNASRLT